MEEASVDVRASVVKLVGFKSVGCVKREQEAREKKESAMNS